MNYLITGSNGFIGHCLVKRLKLDNKNVIYQYDRNSTFPVDLKHFTKFNKGMDVVIHLAAFNSTKDFYSTAYDVIQDNLLPTLNLLNYYRQFEEKPLFIYTGTPEAFAGTTDLFNYKIPTDESVPLVVPDIKNLRWSYAGSKIVCEQAVVASGLDYIIVRPNNIYGPRQKNHFVPEFIERCQQKDYTLYGWKNTRSWLYIDDFIDAFVALIHCKKAIGEIVNIGSNDEVDVLQVAKLIMKYMNVEQEPICKDAPVGSTNRRMPDISKIKSLIDWQPTTSLEEGIKKTVSWYEHLK